MNYVVGDFIIRLKNASSARRKDVVLPYSKLNKEIGHVLAKEGFLEKISEEDLNGKKVLVAHIRYQRRNPVLSGVRIVSKPSLRIHIKNQAVETVEKKGHVTAILSTNSGVMTGKQAQKKGVGGELLFTIW